MKTYKLNITPFLNTQLDPQKSNQGLEYPLYFRVVYQRKSTMLKSIHNEYMSLLRADQLPNSVKNEIDELETLISFFTGGFTNPFDLTGLKEKYQRAQKPAIQVIDNAFRDRLKENLSQLTSPLKYALNIGESSKVYRNNILVEAIYKLFDYDDVDLLLKDTEDFRTIYHLFQRNNQDYDEIRVIDFLSEQGNKHSFSKENDLMNMGDQKLKLHYQKFQNLLVQFITFQKSTHNENHFN
ncbi:hypothetical protein [Jiulongibacter sediminis]|uniref:hypothetical protein n=1 Tax=Jiulongibacter sediminis TaxID=1605367 RepID=UPI0026F29B80|nr:hypothetical protein [Jiulongibacter sediminis]